MKRFYEDDNFIYYPAEHRLIRKGFVDKVGRSYKAKEANISKANNAYGYVVINVNGKMIKAHRLIWVLVNGAIPESLQIDHIDGVKSNNRLENLRLATPKENQHNQRKAQSSNKTGLLGVSWYKSKSKYVARIAINGEVKYLGCFTDKHEAHQAYLQAKRELHTFCTI